ncbi:MAG: hypothetical protein WCX82_03095 [archaeon]|jgi:hypothetical protein
MKKGFIFSITALYFVMLFLLFLSLFLLVVQKPIYRTDISVYDKTNWKVLSGLPSETEPSTSSNYVCVDYLVYDPDMDSNLQSTIEVKKYCENYGIQRFV